MHCDRAEEPLMRRLSPCLLTILFVFNAPAGADQPQGRVDQDVWQAAWLDGNPAGFVHTRFRSVERNGRKLIRSSTELSLTLKRNQGLIRLRMETGDEQMPDGK